MKIYCSHLSFILVARTKYVKAQRQATDQAVGASCQLCGQGGPQVQALTHGTPTPFHALCHEGPATWILWDWLCAGMMGRVSHHLQGQGGSCWWDCQDLLLQVGVQGGARGRGGVRGAVVRRSCHGKPDPRSESVAHQGGLSWLTPGRLAGQLSLPLPSPLLPPPSLQLRAAHPSSPRGGSDSQTQQRFF